MISKFSNKSISADYILFKSLGVTDGFSSEYICEGEVWKRGPFSTSLSPWIWDSWAKAPSIYPHWPHIYLISDFSWNILVFCKNACTNPINAFIDFLYAWFWATDRLYEYNRHRINFLPILNIRNPINSKDNRGNP